MRISDWSSDVCSSDLHRNIGGDDRKVWTKIVETARQHSTALRNPSITRFISGASSRNESWPNGLSSSTKLTAAPAALSAWTIRSEEHTSELQSLMRISYAVSCVQKKNLNQDQEAKERPDKNHYEHHT